LNPEVTGYQALDGGAPRDCTLLGTGNWELEKGEPVVLLSAGLVPWIHMPVEHRVSERRFVAVTTAGEASLEYDLREGTMDLQSTFVPPEARGRGIAAELVAAAVGHARSNGLKIIPTCWYVGRWLGAHPGDRDLVRG
jgi:predicted GNAT family acetyltransferase